MVTDTGLAVLGGLATSPLPLRKSYPLSLHDALPILAVRVTSVPESIHWPLVPPLMLLRATADGRVEEHTSVLQSPMYFVWWFVLIESAWSMVTDTGLAVLGGLATSPLQLRKS